MLVDKLCRHHRRDSRQIRGLERRRRPWQWWPGSSTKPPKDRAMHATQALALTFLFSAFPCTRTPVCTRTARQRVLKRVKKDTIPANTTRRTAPCARLAFSWVKTPERLSRSRPVRSMTPHAIRRPPFPSLSSGHSPIHAKCCGRTAAGTLRTHTHARRTTPVRRRVIAVLPLCRYATPPYDAQACPGRRVGWCYDDMVRAPSGGPRPQGPRDDWLCLSVASSSPAVCAAACTTPRESVQQSAQCTTRFCLVRRLYE